MCWRLSHLQPTGPLSVTNSLISHLGVCGVLISWVCSECCKTWGCWCHTRMLQSFHTSFRNCLLLANNVMGRRSWLSSFKHFLWWGFRTWFPGSTVCLGALHLKLNCSLEIKAEPAIQLSSRENVLQKKLDFMLQKQRWPLDYLLFGFWMFTVPSQPIVIGGRFHLFYLTFYFLTIFNKCPIVYFSTDFCSI